MSGSVIFNFVENKFAIFEIFGRENKLESVVHLLRGRIEDTTLPVEKVDILVSEWMGYFLLFEGMLDSFIYARDNHLAKGGTILPNRCNLSIVGCSDTGNVQIDVNTAIGDCKITVYCYK